jgi:CDP-glycerol glycerophosphotransferase
LSFIFRKIKRFVLLHKLYKFIFILIGLLPTKKNVIIFESFLGKQYSDNPRALYEYLILNSNSYEMYWSFDKDNIKKFQNKKLNMLKRFSFKWLFLVPRAKYWITNSRLPLWIPKPKHTTYIQTWHGTPLKKLGVDIEEVKMPNTTTENYRKNFVYEANKWDYLVSPNNYSTEIFKKAFVYNGKIIESGYPRNDFLTTNNKIDTINSIKRNLKLPENKKIILYAPTWRDNEYHTKGKYKFDLNFDLKKFEEELSDEYIIILRLHYLVSENLNLDGYENFIFDYSNYEDIRDLYLISDILMTDYSSVFFDFSILNRPIIFYTYDLDNYKNELRGFYFDFEKSAPGPICKTSDEVLNNIKKLNQNKKGFQYKEFNAKFCGLETGNSSKMVIETVFKNIKT